MSTSQDLISPAPTTTRGRPSLLRTTLGFRRCPGTQTKNRLICAHQFRQPIQVLGAPIKRSGAYTRRKRGRCAHATWQVACQLRLGGAPRPVGAHGGGASVATTTILPEPAFCGRGFCSGRLRQPAVTRTHTATPHARPRRRAKPQPHPGSGTSPRPPAPEPGFHATRPSPRMRWLISPSPVRRGTLPRRAERDDLRPARPWRQRPTLPRRARWRAAVFPGP